MPRIARIVVPDVPHHVAQRGNNRQDVFFTDNDRTEEIGGCPSFPANIYVPSDVLPEVNRVSRIRVRIATPTCPNTGR